MTGRISESKATMVTDLTQGSVPKLLLMFAMPLFVANALQALYNLVDMIVVGQVIGGAGMSAVSIGGDILHLITFLAMGFSSAGQVLISQYVGAGKMDNVRRLIGTMFTLLLIIAVAISAVCYVFRGPILNALNTPPESYEYTMDYMVTCLVGLIFIYGYNIVSAILRGMGDSKRPFAFIAIAAVLNTVLDIAFVGFCGMEVFGAALATVIGQAVSFIVSIVYLYRRKEEFGFDFQPESFRIDRRIVVPLLQLGIPMAIQSAAVSFSKIVLTSWINAEGVIYSALSGIYNKTGMMIGIVSNSFTVPKILISVLSVGFVISTVVSCLMLLFPEAVCEIFTSDAAVLSEASLVVVPIVVNFYGSATRSGAFSIINGSGNSRLNLLVALLDGMIARISLAAFMGFALGMRCRGFWFGDALAGFMPFVIGSVFYFSGKWRRSVL